MMKCPECNKRMVSEYAELDIKEWYCGDCEVYVEKDGDEIRTYHLEGENDEMS